MIKILLRLKYFVKKHKIRRYIFLKKFHKITKFFRSYNEKKIIHFIDSSYQKHLRKINFIHS